ncbi:centrosomal protein of 120 kDa [Bicyclus anynana]|uniref:Centrosomal protein of 120 kDa n=1 Tax=Bicyclus anynana TaxID=110368 RepID=A0ABM3LTC7_BICAN|nr:centrosomal protein of 120 kDa [Bicyclus anynana]
MDELRGPTIQIVLNVKEGLGFGFLKSPFVVSGSLNGYLLETDPVVPSHAPVFDAELVWEADKRRFRSLRVQNVPVKIEVYMTGTQERKIKIGYLLLSLLSAQPCPSNKVVDIKHSWHKLLGVKSEGKCCHPQLLMSLSVEDRLSTPTPRNELRIFHSNEVALPSVRSNKSAPTPATRSMLLTLNEYLAESRKTVSSVELQPKLLCDEGLIQIGSGNHLFVLGLMIGAVDNLDLLLPADAKNKEINNCYVTYSVFTHNINTDRVNATSVNNGSIAHFNQRTSLRLRTSLASLSRYFAECPHLVTRVCVGDTDVGICSLDLRKLVPTEDVEKFVASFCNEGSALCIQERCYLLRCDDAPQEGGRRAFVDVELSLKYSGVGSNVPVSLCNEGSSTYRSAVTYSAVTTRRRRGAGERSWTSSSVSSIAAWAAMCRSVCATRAALHTGALSLTALTGNNKPPPLLTARSASQLESGRKKEEVEKGGILDFRSGSCTTLDQDVGGVAYTNMAPGNTARYKNASGDVYLQTNELTELIKKMCDSFAQSQERLLSARPKVTSDQQVQCDPTLDAVDGDNDNVEREPDKLSRSKSDTHIKHDENDNSRPTLSIDRESLMQKYVGELEDWKERQQQLFKLQLKRKEDYYLDQLANEWNKRRAELESKLSKGVEQCRNLAADLSRATEDFRLRGYRNTERERKLLDAKKALEAHYTAKYQELREASQKMEDDMNHQLKMKDMALEEVQLKVQSLEKQNAALKNDLKNVEKDAESKYSGLTKDQTASLIQELRCLEEKLESAAAAKAFFKEQWGRAVRELHRAKLGQRARMLAELRQHRRTIADNNLDPIDELDKRNDQKMDVNKLKDDFYMDIMTKNPIESQSIISNDDVLDLYEELRIPKKETSDKLSELISQRDQLILQDSPDEDTLKQLNHEIRSMLIHCGN